MKKVLFLILIAMMLLLVSCATTSENVIDPLGVKIWIYLENSDVLELGKQISSIIRTNYELDSECISKVSMIGAEENISISGNALAISDNLIKANLNLVLDKDRTYAIIDSNPIETKVSYIEGDSVFLEVPRHTFDISSDQQTVLILSEDTLTHELGETNLIVRLSYDPVWTLDGFEARNFVYSIYTYPEKKLIFTVDASGLYHWASYPSYEKNLSLDVLSLMKELSYYFEDPDYYLN